MNPAELDACNILPAEHTKFYEMECVELTKATN